MYATVSLTLRYLVSKACSSIMHRRAARESERDYRKRAIAVAIWNGRRREDSPTITGAALGFRLQVGWVADSRMATTLAAN